MNAAAAASVAPMFALVALGLWAILMVAVLFAAVAVVRDRRHRP